MARHTGSWARAVQTLAASKNIAVFFAHDEDVEFSGDEDLLRQLYHGEKEIENIIDAISAGAEKTILNIPRHNKKHRGSADTLYNNIIIEFENDLKPQLKHAKEQLAGYMLGQFKSGEGYNYTLIASDFINWKVVVRSEELV